MFGIYQQVLGVMNTLPQGVLISGGTITLTTTSTGSAWTPTSVTNTGETLVWNYSGSDYISNAPLIDLSSNGGEATITISSTTQFTGLSSILMDALEITSVDEGTTTFADLTEYSIKLNPGLTSVNTTNMPIIETSIPKNWNNCIHAFSFINSGYIC